MTLGKLIYETNCAIQRKKLAPQTNNEVYYILWQILSSKGLKTNIMFRNKPLKEYNIDSLCALALIQDLERKMGLNSCQVSTEIEAQFNNATTYNYYNEVSIDDIVRIASSKISKPTNEEMFEIELSKFNKKELSARMNNFLLHIKIVQQIIKIGVIHPYFFIFAMCTIHKKTLKKHFIHKKTRPTVVDNK